MGSSAWWDKESIRLNALFESQQFEELYGALRPWIDNADVPKDHQPLVTMLFGKWLQSQGRHKQAIAALEQALQGYSTLYQQTQSQPSALKTLNLLVYLNRVEQAKIFSDELISQHYDDPVFYREMYAELGHIALKNNNNQDHVKYRLASLNWAKQVPDKQQQSVAYNNYAVALRNNGDFPQAQQAFLDALNCAEAAADRVHVNMMKLRLAELALMQQDTEGAQRWLHKIDTTALSFDQIESYRAVFSKVRNATNTIR